MMRLKPKKRKQKNKSRGDKIKEIPKWYLALALIVYEENSDESIEKETNQEIINDS